jgi:hypothetical protein
MGARRPIPGADDRRRSATRFPVTRSLQWRSGRNLHKLSLRPGVLSLFKSPPITDVKIEKVFLGNVSGKRCKGGKLITGCKYTLSSLAKNCFLNVQTETALGR